MDSFVGKWKSIPVMCVGVLLVSVTLSLKSQAQSLRYMDSSGNVRFADSIKEVPREYREQIYPATPTPVLTRQQQAQKRMQEERVQREKLRREQMRQMELDRRAYDADKAARKKRNDLRQDELSSGFQPGAF